jgi:DNA-directed RNA polymerase specialized sigma24 family protein
MSWLYERRYSIDGLRPLIEVAHWATIPYGIPLEDQDDVEQEIIISLLQTIKKYGDKPKSYLEVVARRAVCGYFRKKYKHDKMLHHILESGKGEMVRRTWELLHDGDFDAQLDAIATLASLPKRLVEIGYKRLNGEKLSEADQSYERRQKEKLRPKLNCRKHGNRLSDQEKRRILQMHSEGISMSKIARTLGRTNKAVMRVLGNTKLSREDWLAKMKTAAKEKDEQIRYAYMVEGKTITQILRELHVGRQTVYKAIRAGDRR